jgi:hypothetical protein
MNCSLILRNEMTEGLSRRAMLVRLSAAALLAAGGCRTRSSGSPHAVHIATAAGGLNHQRFKPFASDLMLSPERVRYMQQINLDFHIQNEMLPFERVVDMSLAQDAQKLLQV